MTNERAEYHRQEAADCYTAEGRITVPAADGMRPGHFTSLLRHIAAGRTDLHSAGDAHLAVADVLDSEG